MASRFYFPASTAAEVSPAFDAAWTDTSEAARRMLSEFKGSSAITGGTRIGPLSGTAGHSGLDRQYVSRSLAAQTISGTVKMYLQVRENNATDNVDQLQLCITVVSGDGSTVRGTLLSKGNYGPTAEFVSTLGTFRNKAGADGDSLSSVNALAGDRIVVEIGYSNSTAGTTPEAEARWGEVGTDLAENETDTSANPGWIEFSGTIAMFEWRDFPEISQPFFPPKQPEVIPPDLGAIDALSTGKLQSDWRSGQESVTPDVRWQDRKRRAFSDSYNPSATEAAWIKAGAVDYIAPTYPAADTAGRSVAGTACAIKILTTGTAGGALLGGVVPVNEEVARHLRAIGRERPYKTPYGEQPTSWNYFRCGPGLSNPGEGHFLILEATAAAIESALMDLSQGTGIERKLYIQFEDGNSGAQIKIQVMLAEPMRVVHYSPGAALTGSLYELHVYDTRGYLLNRVASAGAVYNVTTDDPETFFSASLYDFATQGANASVEYTWLQAINHLWLNYCRVDNTIPPNPATSWEMLPATPGLTFPSGTTPTTNPRDLKYQWVNAAAAIDNMLDQNGMFASFDPRTNTVAIQEVGATANVDTSGHLELIKDYYVAGELGPVYSPYYSAAVRRHLVPGKVRVVFPSRWQDAAIDTDRTHSTAFGVNSSTSKDTDHPSSTADPGGQSDPKQTEVLYDPYPAIYDSTNNLQNEAALILRLDYLATRYWHYVNARVGPRTNIGFHDFNNTEDTHSITWQLAGEQPYTHLNGQWLRPGALYPWDKEPTGAEIVGLGGLQAVPQGRGRWALFSAPSAAASLLVVRVATLAPFNVVVQTMSTPGTWTDANAILILAYPDAYAKAQIAAGDTLSDYYTAGSRYWCTVIDGSYIVHHVRMGISTSVVYVSDVTWNQTTCTLSKTTKTMVFEDGLLQSNT